MTFIAGLVLFLGIHLLPTRTALRAHLLAMTGATAYKIIFSLVSLAAFLLMLNGFGEARTASWNSVIWSPPLWTKHVAFVLMWPAFVLMVAAYVPSNIRTRAKHPMLASIKIWALAHLLANGDLVGMILFGAFLAYGVVDRISVKKRAAAGPLGDKRGGMLNDILVLVIGTAAYGVMLFYGHAAWIGVALLPD
jgi:uncharacterized membrane protein